MGLSILNSLAYTDTRVKYNGTRVEQDKRHDWLYPSLMRLYLHLMHLRYFLPASPLQEPRDQPF